MRNPALDNKVANYLIKEWPEFLILSKRYRMAEEIIAMVQEDSYELGRLAGIREERVRAISVERVALAHNSTDTQQAAAFLALPESGTLRRRIFDLIERKPRTDDELENLTGRSHQSVSARRRELVLGGFIVDSGERRKTRRGTTASVWRLKDNAQCDPVPTTDSDNLPPCPKCGYPAVSVRDYAGSAMYRCDRYSLHNDHLMYDFRSYGWAVGSFR